MRLLFVLTALISIGAKTPVPANEANPWLYFQKKEYSAYLKHLDQQIGLQEPQCLETNFSRLVAIAIALNKSDNPQVILERARAHLKELPKALRYFNATQQILQGNVEATKLFFQGEPPLFDSWKLQVAVLRMHGYEAESDAMESLMMIGGAGFMHNNAHLPQCLEAWSRLKVEHRRVLLPFFHETLRPHQFRMRGIIDEIIKMIDKRPERSRALYELLKRLSDNPGVADISHLQAIVGKADSSIVLDFSNHLTSHAPLQAKGAGATLQASGSSEAVKAYYSKWLKDNDLPRRHSVLVDYMRWLAAHEHNQLSVVANLEGRFGKATEAAIQRKTNEAAVAFQAIVEDKNTGDAERIAALEELLFIRPEGALKSLQIADFQQLDSSQLCSIAQSLWLWVRREVGADTLAQGLLRDAAIVMQRMIDQRPDVLLRRHDQESPSLRVPMAICYRILNDTVAAEAILVRQIRYQAPPPTSGWRNPPGVKPPKDAFLARQVEYPVTDDEIRSLRSEVELSLKRLNSGKRQFE
jgi:hypothetical protein